MELSALITAAELMAISARTAPKSKGSDVIEINILGAEQLEQLAVEMEEIAAATGMKFFLVMPETSGRAEHVFSLVLTDFLRSVSTAAPAVTQPALK